MEQVTLSVTKDDDITKIIFVIYPSYCNLLQFYQDVDS